MTSEFSFIERFTEGLKKYDNFSTYENLHKKLKGSFHMLSIIILFLYEKYK